MTSGSGARSRMNLEILERMKLLRWARTARRGALGLATRVGLLDLVADSEWRRRRLIILGYHGVSMDEEHKWRRPLYFTAKELEDRLTLLHRWRINVLPLPDAFDRLQAGTLPPRSAVLTFDDGNADFASIVWPMLKRFGYPGTVYATTYYSEKRHPIFSLMCSYLLWKARERVLTPLAELGLDGTTDLSSAVERRRAHQLVIERARQDQLTADEQNERAAALARRLAIDYQDLLSRRVLQLMTPEEIRRVAEDGADVQLHTHRHRAPRALDLFEREIIDNRTRLETLISRRPEHFCYPSGVHHPEFLPLLTAQHVVTATTCEPGLATKVSPPLLLPRVIDTAALTPNDLAGWLSGVGQALHL